jgi:flagellar basal-body rod modification protein FlgD
MIETVSGSAAATASSGSRTNAAGGAMGKDEFLKHLVAQMSHQDPLNPMDGAQYAAQLAQFSSVEQLVSMNAKLDEQAAAQASIVGALNGSAALAAFGHEVVAIGDQVSIQDGRPASVTFSVDGTGGEGTPAILAADGGVVGSRPLVHVGGGTQSVELGSAADGLAAGTYTYAVRVKDDAGNDVTTQTYSTGRVDGIHYGATGPVLTSGDLEIPFGSIVQILAGK